MTFLYYVYYRLYVKYKQKNDPPKFFSTSFLSIFLIFISMPITGLIASFFRTQTNSFLKYSLFLSFIFIVGFTYFFITTKTNLILKRYENSKWNAKNPFWLIFSLIPFSMITGVLTYGFITVKIIKSYNLDGILFR